ncbi:MAG: RnfABCDGE type electron transport complex subunit G [Kiritimatiellae bacterium]|jgi:electron transport complex protein RnfG|nr:RnfABCDGE type electron transport complex subunit G [Kiritimatiellia bacterium]
MKETLRLVAVLTIICAVSAALLATVYNKTMGPILKALEIKTSEAAQKVMPPDASEITKEIVGKETFFVCRSGDGKVAAVAVEGLSKNGYGGNISLMVGLSAEKKVISYQVITANETPGLGSNISSTEFSAPFCGKPFSSNWKVKKDGGEFDAITSATISSRAALECIKDAISKYESALAKLNTSS